MGARLGGLLALVVGVGACSPEGPVGSNGGLASEYAPDPGATFEFVPAGAMQALYEQDPEASSSGLDTLRIQVTDTAWEMVVDEGGNETLTARLGDDGLYVGASHVLPYRTGEGEEGDGVVVEAAGDYTVWYGTFSEASSVRIDGGELSGDATLARFVGPIRVSFAGKVWELVYYERPTE